MSTFARHGVLKHANLRGDELHVPGYRQSSDPGAIGAGMLWEDTDTGTIYKRNLANTDWVPIGGSSRLCFVVTDYGAVGDGVADDTAAIQAAYAAAVVSGGVVFLPPGTYRLATTVNVTSDLLELKGSGVNASILKPDAGVDGVTITCPNGGNLAGLKFADFQVSGGRYGIYITDSDQGGGASVGLTTSVFERVFCASQTTAGIYADTWSIIETTWDHVRTEGIDTCPYGMYLKTIGNILSIVDCQFRRSATAGLYLYGLLPASANVIQSTGVKRCIFESNQEVGLKIHNAIGLAIEEGWFENNGRRSTGGPYPHVAISADTAETRNLAFKRCQLNPSASNNQNLLSIQVQSTLVLGPITLEDCNFGADGGAQQGTVDLWSYAYKPATIVQGSRPAFTGTPGRNLYLSKPETQSGQTHYAVDTVNRIRCAGVDSAASGSGSTTVRIGFSFAANIGPEANGENVVNVDVGAPTLVFGAFTGCTYYALRVRQGTLSSGAPGTAIGLDIADVTIGSGLNANYAINTGLGRVQFGDIMLCESRAGVGTSIDTGSMLRVDQPATPVTTGVTQRGINVDFAGQSGATTEISGFAVRAQTAAASFTCAELNGIEISAPVLGSGSAVTQLCGLLIGNQTGGTNNFAIKTGTGYVSIGDRFACNAATPQGKATLGAAATDLASVLTLANNLRTMAINNGMGQN